MKIHSKEELKILHSIIEEKNYKIGLETMRADDEVFLFAKKLPDNESW